MSLQIEHVNYIYNEGTPMEVYALKDISFELHDGEFAALIGHTGSGKSTLTQLMNGLLTANSGTIRFDGRDIHEPGFALKDLRRQVGLVFQYPEHQLFEVDVITDVMFGPKNLGLSPEEARERAKEALALVGMGEEIYEKSPFDLSGGQKRRVAIAGVLAMKPKVIILDEPTAGLDPKGRDEILDELDRLNKEQNLTILLVSHSMEDVAEHASRLLVLSQGDLLFDAPPKEVFRHVEELEAVGLSVPQVSYIVRECKKRGIDLGEDITTVQEARDAILKLWAEKTKR